MEISSIFKNNENIPSKYTCDGSNISPELTVTNIPENTASLVLIMDDPDAPGQTWDHWIVFNMPVTNKIEEGVSPQGIKGTNSWNKLGYGGPCPPSGTHRYFFKLFALDTNLNLEEGATKQEIETAMQPHIIEKAELIGLYSRS